MNVEINRSCSFHSSPDPSRLQNTVEADPAEDERVLKAAVTAKHTIVSAVHAVAMPVMATIMPTLHKSVAFQVIKFLPVLID